MIEQCTNIGKYILRGEVGRGSMGIVYLAHDPYVNRSVAIKVALNPKTDAVVDKELNHKIFFNEAHIAGSLAHPNIISIFDAGIDKDTCYIVMEYIESGQTLKSFTKKNTLLPIDTVINIIFKCVNALEYAHQAGVLHQDIKPSNILVADLGNIKIGDFSIARFNNINSFNAQEFQQRGSPRYMAPEQFRKEKITPQTDLFALGVVFYELLTGQIPFFGKDFRELKKNILDSEPKPVRECRKDIPEALAKIVHRAIAKDLNQRYQDCSEFAVDLLKFMDNINHAVQGISEKEKLLMINKLDFFKSFSKEDIVELAKNGCWIDCVADEYIILEGDLDDCFYIIISGQVKVLKGKQMIRMLKSGDCFGEMGYVTNSMRTASIKSTELTVLFKITSTMLSKMTQHCQIKFLKKFLRTLIQRLSFTTSQIYKSG